MPLRVGDPAPAFEAPDQDGRVVRSSDLRGTRHVLYFYPRDDTLICTREACAFESARPDLERLGIPVFGVSPDTVRRHAGFAGRQGLHFRLLADPDRRLIRAYRADGLLGRTTRVTYLIGPDGTIEGVHRAELSGQGHVDWVRRALDGRVALEGAPPAGGE